MSVTKTSTNKKKVCFLMERRGLYDDRAYWKQAMALKNVGFEIHYLIISHTEKAIKGTTSEGIHYQIFEGVKYIPSVIGNYLMKKFVPVHTEFDQMLTEVIRIQPDLIQIVDLRVLRILGKIKRVVPKVKVVYDIREPRDTNLLDIRMKEWKIPYTLKKRYADYIQQWEYKKATKCDYLLGVDDGIAKRIQTNLPTKPYQTIYNFTNLSNQRDYVPIQHRKFDFAYVGGLSEVRGAKTILQATQIVCKEFHNVQLLLLGASYNADLTKWIEQFVEQNELENNVTWVKGVKYQEVPRYYNQIKLGLNPLKNVPAHREIIQIKLFEYMNYGIPIITSNFGAMQRYVEENLVGVCIDAENPNALAQAIIHLLINDEKLNLYSKNGYDAVDTKFNWDLMEEKYLKIVKEVISS